MVQLMRKLLTRRPAALLMVGVVVCDELLVVEPKVLRMEEPRRRSARINDDPCPSH